MHSATLPAYASIFGDTHFPPVDNQGAIGSCASQAITRNQFGNAVSRLIHAQNEGSAFCPRDNFGDAFTPKYSYNIAGPGLWQNMRWSMASTLPLRCRLR